MKLLGSLSLAGLLFAVPGLAADGSAPGPRPEGPPPFECPLCGGNAEAHKVRVAGIAWLNGRAVSAVVSGVFHGRRPAQRT